MFTSSGDHPTTIAVLGYACAASGRSSEAREALNRLQKLSEEGTVLPFAMALLYTGLGEKDEAFAWLEKSREERDPQLTWVRADPELECLHSDRRFSALLGRMGLLP